METVNIPAGELQVGRHRWGGSGEWVIVDAYTNQDDQARPCRAGFTPADGHVAVISRLARDPEIRDAELWPVDPVITASLIGPRWWSGNDQWKGDDAVLRVMVTAPEVDPSIIFPLPGVYGMAVDRAARAFAGAWEVCAHRAAAMAGWNADDSRYGRLMLRDAWWSTEELREASGRRLIELAAYAAEQGFPGRALVAESWATEPVRAALSGAGLGALLPERRAAGFGPGSDL